MADGQVTRGNEIVKPNVTKVRRLNDSVISGFAGMQYMQGVSSSTCLLAPSISQNLESLSHAGATADAFTLYDRLETQLEQHSGETASWSQCMLAVLFVPFRLSQTAC